MNYQSSSDEEPVSNKLNRPPDQASRMGMNYQMGGADSIEELGTSAMKPPFSNPGDREYQMTGAEPVEEVGGTSRETWPMAKSAGNLNKPL